jgi:hypothetical protein
MTRLSFFASVLPFAFTVFHASPAVAGPSAHPLEGAAFPSCPSKKGTISAEAHYGAGRAAYDARNLPLALTEFFEAYTLECEQHEILIIISRSYELDKNYKDAARALEVYRQRTKDVSNEHVPRINSLKEEQKKEDAAAAALADANARANAKANATVKTVAIREHTAAPWVVAGIGGAALLTGAVFLATYKSPNGFSRRGDKEACALDSFPSASDNGHCENIEGRSNSVTFRNVGGWLVIGGAATLAGGILWHFLEPTGSESATAFHVTPEVSPSYAGATIARAF